MNNSSNNAAFLVFGTNLLNRNPFLNQFQHCALTDAKNTILGRVSIIRSDYPRKQSSAQTGSERPAGQTSRRPGGSISVDPQIWSRF